MPRELFPFSTGRVTRSVDVELIPELGLINDCLHQFQHLAVASLEPVLNGSAGMVEAFHLRIEGPDEQLRAFNEVIRECGLRRQDLPA